MYGRCQKVDFASKPGSLSCTDIPNLVPIRQHDANCITVVYVPWIRYELHGVANRAMLDGFRPACAVIVLVPGALDLAEIDGYPQVPIVLG